MSCKLKIFKIDWIITGSKGDQGPRGERGRQGQTGRQGKVLCPTVPAEELVHCIEDKADKLLNLLIKEIETWLRARGFGSNLGCLTILLEVLISAVVFDVNTKNL